MARKVTTTARKTATRPRSAAKPSKARGRQKASAKRSSRQHRATIRMYRQGFGDCHLVRLPRKRKGDRDYVILIDCGVIIGTPDGTATMRSIAEDILATTGGVIDLLIVTHEHWDHLSGFVQAEDIFRKFTIHETWFAWTEDPEDELAQKLKREMALALQGLRLSASRLQLAGAPDVLAEVESVLSFFGAGRGATTQDAMDIVRSINTDNIRYRRPNDIPQEPSHLGGVRFYIMGPPPDERRLKRIDPSKGDGFGLALDDFVDQINPVLAGIRNAPFDPIYAIPFDVAAETDFFKTRYWEGGRTGTGWRRIEDVWLGGTTELALQLDNMTNNTSLVLAIELDGGDVLLFAGDAQAGNWLSWQDLTWSVDGADVTGADLLSRTIYYKVGHHGSRNATLRRAGIDLMTKLQVATIPVDQDVATKKGWGRIPLPEIVSELQSLTKGRVFRSDMPAGTRVPEGVEATDLWIEVTL